MDNLGNAPLPVIVITFTFSKLWKYSRLSNSIVVKSRFMRNNKFSEFVNSDFLYASVL